jgi:hypothetical protein
LPVLYSGLFAAGKSAFLPESATLILANGETVSTFFRRPCLSAHHR